MAKEAPSASRKKLLLVDGANSLYRAFFAIPPLRAPDGTPTNAAYGFVNMLLKVIREESPDHVAVIFDAPGKTFRHELFDDYKATRDAQPEDLSAQLPLVRELIEAYRIPLVTVPGFEADDVIATLVERAPEELEIAIVSTDRDLMQLVGERVQLLDGIRDRRYGPAEVEARFGVAPEKVLDLRALVGDTSDNIPGVKGIGEKTAAQLLRDYGDLDAVLASAERIKGKRAREALLAESGQARLSRELATLRVDVPLSVDVDDLARRDPDRTRLRALFERMGFTRLLAALDEESGASSGAAAGPDLDPDVEVERVRDAAALAGLADELAKLPSVPLRIWSGEGDPISAEPVGVAFALGERRAAYLPLGSGGLDVAEIAPQLAPVIGAGGSVSWVGLDTKQSQVAFGERGLELGPPGFDVGLAAQLLDPAGSNALPAIAAGHLGRRVPAWEDVAGRGARARPAAEIPAPELAALAAAQVCALRDLEAPLAGRLESDGLWSLYEEVELPLTRTLSRMERAGVRVDEGKLEELSLEYQKQLDQIEAEIYRLAGESFQINSPKQLQRVLFEKLKLPAVKKTKPGFSTSEDVLEQLAGQHEMPLRILAYRRLSKLKNTYLAALPLLVNPRTGRIHPTFHQLGAATGRLSAANPNVQNIPIRSEEGVRIREAFVPAEGCRLISADYSQVELRILAHYSEDERLLDAFRRGEDIHRETAAAVAGIEPEQVSPEQRARAKAVNFGIIYGLSAFGLANQLGIATSDAQQWIETYFARYRGVRRFLDETIAAARERGHVTTFLGRRRYLPDLRSRNRALRGAAERMAVNTVIQGTAADVIKKAMLAVDAAFEAEGLAARMILQVHDELVFEAPLSEVERVSTLVRERMESVLALRVPLEVEVGAGASWREAH